MRPLRIVLFVFVAAVCLPLAAAARHPDVIAAVDRLFARLDLDGDASLTQEEFTRLEGGLLPAPGSAADGLPLGWPATKELADDLFRHALQEADADGDGLLQRGEIMDHPESLAFVLDLP